MHLINKTFKLSLSLAKLLLEHALSSPHKEVCGLVAIENSGSQHCYPVANTASTPDTQFEMDSEQLISTIKNIRSLDQTLIAIYHSHPNGNIEPSPIDIKQHQYHDLFYFIISPGNDGVLNLGAYMIHENKTIERLTLIT